MSCPNCGSEMERLEREKLVFNKLFKQSRKIVLMIANDTTIVFRKEFIDEIIKLHKLNIELADQIIKTKGGGA